jgi:hypothetical protein
MLWGKHSFMQRPDMDFNVLDVLVFLSTPTVCQWRCGRQGCIINDDKMKSAIRKIRVLYTVPEGVNHWLKL